MNKYREKALRELYRIDNKYWRTGDTDLLDKRFAIAKMVSERYWDCIASITSVATRQHLPVQALADALMALGFEMEEEAEDGGDQ